MGPKRANMQGGGGGRGNSGPGPGRGGRGRGRGRGGGGVGHGGNDEDCADDEGHVSTGQGMVWPPVIMNMKVHGEIKDVNGRNIPRDQGRSIQLGDEVFYVFGDTFCHNDQRNFVGTTDNTIGYVPDKSRPWMSQYLSKQPRVPQYIPYTQSEREYTEAPENKKVNSRIVIWSFGGVIEDTPGCGKGWVFFDKLITNGAKPGHFFGMSVGRVSLYDGHNIKVERVCGDRMIFGTDEPKFGSISCLCDDDGWVYLLGHKDRMKPLDLRNHWARIRRDADFTNRDNYEFLLKNGKWSPTYQLDNLKIVIPIQAQGAILKLPGFAPKNKGPYMWFGVNKYMGNVLFVGSSPAIDGPWDVHNVMEIPKILGDKSNARYCLYPHPWAADLDKGQMFISWSDNGDFGGRVGCAMLRFQMVGEHQDVDQEIHERDQQRMQAMPPTQQSSDGAMGSLKEKFLGRLWG